MADVLPPIPRAPDPEPALELQALYDEGLEHARRLARAQWTDHNTHDPGITMLELACYALTELAYRHTLPLADRLACGGPAQFHAPEAVLPQRAFTADDWRRLAIDLPGIKNAWLEPVTDQRLVADLRRRELRRDPPTHDQWREVTLGGLHRLRVEFMDHVGTQAARQAVLAALRSALHASRNLCEDFIEVRAVRAQYFALCAEVDLTPDADVVEAAARLLFDIGLALAPPVRPQSLAERLAAGEALPDIVRGPLPQHGFVDDAQLAATTLPTDIRLSDLIGVAMDVPGVRSIRDARLNPVRRADEDDDGGIDADPAEVQGDAEVVANPWRVPVRAGRLPRLALSLGRLVFSKRGLPVMGFNLAQMPAAVATRLAALREAERRRAEVDIQVTLPTPPLGQARPLAHWDSFQLDFPALYGIGAQGLGARATDQRRAQALQLQGWLLFFDQAMADQLALLAAAPQRLSVAPAALQSVADAFGAAATERPHVLASQVVDTIVRHDRLYPPGANAQRLADAMESHDDAVRRQQALLDHLLARVAEDFADYAGAMASAFGADAGQLIADKCGFLAEVGPLVHHRAGALNLRPVAVADDGGVWNTSNVSGLERRLARLLGIADFTRRNLGAVSYDMYAEVDRVPDSADEWRFRVKHAFTDAILLSSSTHYATQEAARAEMIQAIQAGQSPAGYQRRVAGDGRHYFNIVGGEGQVLARRIQYWEDAARMDAAIAELQAYLTEHYSGEGMYVVEHILLRPSAADDPLLPICADPLCVDGVDLDPYSHRLHVVLPAYAGRFQDMGFRQFVEQTIRRETPAHLLPTVCWVDADDMARFESAWRGFLELHVGSATGGRRQRLQALIDALVSVKNIYPSRTLFDCTGDETRPPFVLGRTSLGRGPSET
jgi:hypothetical protein